MDQQQLKNTIQKIMENDMVGVMATVRQNKPYSRYMTFFHDDLKLYTMTNKETHKVDDIEANPNTHIMLGYEGEGFGDKYVEYEGTASINHDEGLKEKLWTPQMETWFSGVNDPNLIILEITPNRIDLMNKKGEPPKTLTLD